MPLMLKRLAEAIHFQASQEYRVLSRTSSHDGHMGLVLRWCQILLFARVFASYKDRGSPTVENLSAACGQVLRTCEGKGLAFVPDQLPCQRQHICISAPIIQQSHLLLLQAEEREVSWLWGCLHILDTKDGRRCTVSPTLLRGTGAFAFPVAPEASCSG